MDNQQFSAVFDGLMRCLPHLSGQQSEALRTLLDRNGSLVECPTIARRRGGHASRRGITSEHDCILVARDRTGATIS